MSVQVHVLILIVSTCIITKIENKSLYIYVYIIYTLCIIMYIFCEMS